VRVRVRVRVRASADLADQGVALPHVRVAVAAVVRVALDGGWPREERVERALALLVLLQESRDCVAAVRGWVEGWVKSQARPR